MGVACDTKQGPVSFLSTSQVHSLYPTVTGQSVHHYLGRTGELLHQSNSCSHSLIVLNLSTSTLSSATMLIRSTTCLHLAQQSLCHPPLVATGSSFYSYFKFQYLKSIFSYFSYFTCSRHLDVFRHVCLFPLRERLHIISRVISCHRPAIIESGYHFRAMLVNNTKRQYKNQYHHYHNTF